MNYNNILLLQKANNELTEKVPLNIKDKKKISINYYQPEISTYQYDTLAKKKYYVLKGKIISMLNNIITVKYDNQDYFYNLFSTKYKKHIEELKDSAENVKIIKSPIDEDTFTFKYQESTYYNKQNQIDIVKKDCMCEFYVKIVGYNFTKNNESIIGLKLHVLKIKQLTH
jgi:hypothetical protein